MSNVARERLEAVERALCTAVDLDVEHEPDEPRDWTDRWWDARLHTAAQAVLDASVVGADEIVADRVEFKTCQRRIDDTHSSNGRRGRWTIHEVNHQERLAAGVPTLFAVLEDTTLLAVRLVTADVVDELLADHWTTGDGTGRGRSAQLPWFRLIDEAAVDVDAPLCELDVREGSG